MGFSGLCRASGARSRAARNAATNPPRGNASEPPARAREQTKCAPTKPLAETTGALRASERRHNLRTGTKQARGNTPVSCGVPASVEPRRGDTTPRTPGVSPGNSLASKTNPSLGEAAQSPRRVSAFSIRAGARGRLLLSLKRKSVPAGKPCGDASFRRAFFRTRRRADFRCRRCADARRSCPAADRARDGSGDCLRGIRGRRCRRGFLSARRRPDR